MRERKDVPDWFKATARRMSGTVGGSVETYWSDDAVYFARVFVGGIRLVIRATTPADVSILTRDGRVYLAKESDNG